MYACIWYERESSCTEGIKWCWISTTTLHSCTLQGKEAFYTRQKKNMLITAKILIKVCIWGRVLYSQRAAVLCICGTVTVFMWNRLHYPAAWGIQPLGKRWLNTVGKVFVLNCQVGFIYIFFSWFTFCWRQNKANGVRCEWHKLKEDILTQHLVFLFFFLLAWSSCESLFMLDRWEASIKLHLTHSCKTKSWLLRKTAQLYYTLAK